MSDTCEILVVDDERTFATDAEVTYLRTADEALAHLAAWWTDNQTRPLGAEVPWIRAIFFDHDLGDGADASVVARFLRELHRTSGALPIEAIHIHSQNPVGAANLFNTCRGLANVVSIIPLPPLI